MAKTALNSKLELNLKKKLPNCEIWSIASYGAETWKLRKVDHKYLDSFEVFCWRKMEKISWTDHVRNEEMLLKIQGGEKYPKKNKKNEGRIIHIFRRNCLQRHFVEGKIERNV
jgi:hypothetical protein